jgi:hypothetical protein
MVTDIGGGGFTTLTLVLPYTPSITAVTVVLPAVIAEMPPPDEMVATDVLLLLQELTLLLVKLPLPS